ncbi:partner and localizer of BRCA2 isoform X2 [Saccopteryx bilineata]|uniref:partner and localizer of BRCA2 isoform X2 n=1 Tax=Saccopteryx bilineata TaxID=59482 RepID=UPI00338F570E
MEEPPGKPLSCEEKEKLKEKLAFLKREYSRTLARLQRAQRAEKVKSCIRKAEKEQGCSPQQEASPQRNCSEPETKVSPCDALHVHPHLGEAGNGKLEFLDLGRGPAGGLGAQGMDGGPEHFSSRVGGPAGEKRQRKPPGRKKQQKTTFISPERESFFDAESLLVSGKRLKEAGEVNGGSPGIPGTKVRTCSSSPPWNVPASQASGTGMEGGGVFVPPNAEAQGAVGALLGGGHLSRAPPPPPRPPSDSCSGQHLHPKPPEGSCTVPAYGLENVDPASPVSVEAHGEEMTGFTGNPAVSESGRAGGQLPSSPAVEADDACSVNELTCNVPASEKQTLEERDHTERSSDAPSNALDGRHESLQEDAVLSQAESPGSEVVPPVPAGGGTHPCPAPEGLPFPAEYHVRTTRSMSNCQRQVAPGAVIQSQLGVRKEATKVLHLPDEERNGGDVVVCRPDTGQASSGSPFQRFLSLPAVGSPAGPTEDDVPRKAVTQPSGRRRRGDREPAGSPALWPHALLWPAPGTWGVDVSQDEATSHRDQNGRPGVHGERGVTGKEGPCQQEDCFSSSRDACSALNDGACRAPPPKNEMLSLKQLLSFLKITDFQLPDEDFGPLKLEKLRSCSAKPAEPPGSDVLGERRLAARRLKRRPRREGLSSSMLLFTPPNTGSPDDDAGAVEALGSPAFPVLGTTPAPGSQAQCGTASAEAAGRACSSPPSSHGGAGGSTRRHGGASPPEVDGSPPASGRKGQPDCDCDPGSGPQATPAPAGSFTVTESPLPGNTCPESWGRSVEQTEIADVPACDSLTPGGLQLVSKLKKTDPEYSLNLNSRCCRSGQNPAGSCAVDVSAVCWETAGFREPCIVTACEDTVSLWRRLGAWQWEKVYSWHFAEVPVLQIVPVPDAYDLVCVALGSLEIREIRALLCSSDGEREKQVLLSSGNIQAVLGLTGRRLVSSRGTLCDQHIEILMLAEDGGCRSKEKQFLMPPEETVLTFAEVQGMQEALLGTTVTSSIVIWNLKTGQLLKKMHIGDSYQATVCHRAYSEMVSLELRRRRWPARYRVETDMCGDGRARTRGGPARLRPCRLWTPGCSSPCPAASEDVGSGGAAFCCPESSLRQREGAVGKPRVPAHRDQPDLGPEHGRGALLPSSGAGWQVPGR